MNNIAVIPLVLVVVYKLSEGAAGLMILDIKPFPRAINERDKTACDEAMRKLQSKIEERQA